MKVLLYAHSPKNSNFIQPDRVLMFQIIFQLVNESFGCEVPRLDLLLVRFNSSSQEEIRLVLFNFNSELCKSGRLPIRTIFAIYTLLIFVYRLVGDDYLK